MQMQLVTFNRLSLFSQFVAGHHQSRRCPSQPVPDPADGQAQRQLGARDLKRPQLPRRRHL